MPMATAAAEVEVDAETGEVAFARISSSRTIAVVSSTLRSWRGKFSAAPPTASAIPCSSARRSSAPMDKPPTTTLCRLSPGHRDRNAERDELVHQEIADAAQSARHQRRRRGRHFADGRRYYLRHRGCAHAVWRESISPSAGLAGPIIVAAIATAKGQHKR